MNGKNYKVGLLATILILVLGAGVLVMRAAPAAQAPGLSDATRDKILTYIRERIGWPDTVKLTLGALQASTVAPGFNQAAVTVGEGKNQRAQLVLVAKDAHYLILVNGSIIELHQNSHGGDGTAHPGSLQDPCHTKLSVGGFKPSPSPDFRGRDPYRR